MNIPYSTIIGALLYTAAYCPQAHAQQQPAPPATKVPSASISQLFDQMLDLAAGNEDSARTYLTLREQMLAYGPQAQLFLSQKALAPDWKSKWLASALLQHLQSPAKYQDFQNLSHKRRAALTPRQWTYNARGDRVRIPISGFHVGPPALDKSLVDSLSSPIPGLDTPEVGPFLVESMIWTELVDGSVSTLSLSLLRRGDTWAPLVFLATTSSSHSEFSSNARSMRGLQKWGGKEAVQVLSQILNRDPDPNMQRAAIDNLQGMRERSAIPALETFLKKTKNEELLRNARMALVTLQEQPVTPLPPNPTPPIDWEKSGAGTPTFFMEDLDRGGPEF